MFLKVSLAREPRGPCSGWPAMADLTKLDHELDRKTGVCLAIRTFLDRLNQFWVNKAKLEGKEFKVLAVRDPDAAVELVRGLQGGEEGLAPQRSLHWTDDRHAHDPEAIRPASGLTSAIAGASEGFSCPITGESPCLAGATAQTRDQRVDEPDGERERRRASGAEER